MQGKTSDRLDTSLFRNHQLIRADRPDSPAFASSFLSFFVSRLKGLLTPKKRFASFCFLMRSKRAIAGSFSSLASRLGKILTYLSNLASSPSSTPFDSPSSSPSLPPCLSNDAEARRTFRPPFPSSSPLSSSPETGSSCSVVSLRCLPTMREEDLNALAVAGAC